jgi:hypothetical protein
VDGFSAPFPPANCEYASADSRNALVRRGVGPPNFRASQPRKFPGTSRKRDRRAHSVWARTTRSKVRGLGRRPPLFVERGSARRGVAGPRPGYANRYHPQLPLICRLSGASHVAALAIPLREPSLPRCCADAPLAPGGVKRTAACLRPRARPAPRSPSDRLPPSNEIITDS